MKYVFFVSALLFVQNASTGSLIEPPATSVNSQHYCEVKQPVILPFLSNTSKRYNDLNFSELYNSKNDSIIKFVENTHLRVQFCKPLLKPCNGKTNYAVCLHKSDGEQIGLGKEPPVLDSMFHDRIKFIYSGDKCNATHNYTIIFEMKCNYSMVNKTAADIDFSHAEDECEATIILETSAACVKETDKCIARDEVNRYDLNPLKNSVDNYEIDVTENITVILNVCQDLNFGKHSKYCLDSAVCLIDKTNRSNFSYTSLGKFSEGNRSEVRIHNKVLTLTYFNGDACDEINANASEPPRIQTTLLFVCDPTAARGSPVFHQKSRSCNYEFIWPTSAACSAKILEKQALSTRNFCIIKDPLTDYEYDFTQLRHIAYKYPFRKGPNHSLLLSVCGRINNSKCPKDSGVCLILNKNGTNVGESGGVSNSNLMWTKEGPYLNYTDGHICSNGQRRFTVISFACDENRFVHTENSCSTFILVGTEFMCSKPCSTSDGKFSLTELVNYTENYEIKVNKNLKYELNICANLNHYYDSDASIYKIFYDDRGRFINRTNLGHSEYHVRTLNSTSAVLAYKDGSQCEEDRSRTVSAQVIFKCDISIPIGNPKFKNYHDCMYNFEWETVHSCSQIYGIVTNDCKAINELGDERDILPVSDWTVNHTDSYEDAGRFKIYNITVCGNNEYCEDSFVCDGEFNYGTQLEVQFDYKKKLIRFHFSNGSKCENGTLRQATLTVQCVNFYHPGSVDLISEQPCNLEFRWITHLDLCLPKKNTPQLPMPPAVDQSVDWTLDIFGLVFSSLLTLILVAVCIVFKTTISDISRSVMIQYRVRYSAANDEAEDGTWLSSDS